MPRVLLRKGFVGDLRVQIVADGFYLVRDVSKC